MTINISVFILLYVNVHVCEIVSVAKTAHSGVARSLLRCIIILKTICIIINRVISVDK